MLVLLDETITRKLAPAIPGHVVRPVRQMGWDGRRNGDLPRVAAAAGFGALSTADRRMEVQQDVGRIGLGLVVLVVRSTAPERIVPLAPGVAAALSTIQPGHVVHVGASHRP